MLKIGKYGLRKDFCSCKNLSSMLSHSGWDQNLIFCHLMKIPNSNCEDLSSGLIDLPHSPVPATGSTAARICLYLSGFHLTLYAYRDFQCCLFILFLWTQLCVYLFYSEFEDVCIARPILPEGLSQTAPAVYWSYLEWWIYIVICFKPGYWEYPQFCLYNYPMTTGSLNLHQKKKKKKKKWGNIEAKYWHSLLSI